MDSAHEGELFRSKVDKNSEAFTRNHAQMSELVSKLEQELAKRMEQGPARHQERHMKRGKLLARDRIELLLDPDTPFLELLPLAGCREKGEVNFIVGIGIVW